MSVWLVVIVAGRLFASEAPSQDACFQGEAAVRAMLPRAKINCVVLTAPPKGATDLIEWLKKGDA